MSSTSHFPRSVKSLRRFVTVVACEFRFAQRDLEELGEETVGLGVDVVWNILAEKARENGGLVLPLHGSSANVVFGYPNPDADHAARAVQCARQFVDAAVTERNNAQWIPSFGVGIHSADCLILEQGHRSSRSISISGAAPDCAALLSHVPRNGEILLTESTLRTFSSDLPSGLETIQVQFEKEPDLDGLNWEAVVFLGLPDHLQREAVLAGPGVADNPGGAEYFFRYLFSIKIVSARTTLNILSLQAVEHAPSFLLQAQAIRSEDEMTRLGAYTLIKRLGTGGTGQVWLARDFHGNLVALKSLQEAFAGDQRLISRLQREARAMASLPHPNICQIYEVGETDGLHFIAMEYVSGTTLADLLWSGSVAIANSGTIAEIIQWIQKWQQSHDETEMGIHPRRLPLSESLRMFCKVCDAVAFAHEHGILHRDLKPGNILLRENGEPVVSDFGLAKLESADTENSLSLHGEILGTLDYMAPEQAHDSKNVDERADIYGLGAILYLLLSGRPHFSPGGDILKDATRLQTHEPKPLRSLVGNLHPDIALIAEKCLRPHRHDRYQSARMLRDDIDRFLLGQPILARPPSPLRAANAWMSRHKSVVSTVAAACLVMVLFAFYSFAQINRKRIAAEEALATAREAQARAEDNEKRLVSALKEATQNRLRADSAEFDKNQIVSEREKERTGLEEERKALARQQRAMEEQGNAFADASKLTRADALPGDDLANPPEPPRITDSSARGTACLLNYSPSFAQKPDANGWWPFNLTPNQSPVPTPSPVVVPQVEKASEISDVIIRMNAVFSTFPQSAPTDQILAKLRPLIGSFGASLDSMNSHSSKDPTYVLLCAKYDSLLMDGANVSDLLQRAGKLAVESNASSLVEECRTLQETLQQTDHGGDLITPFGLRRTGTPDNIRLAALYENIGELTKRYTKSTGLPFPPDLLRRESQPSTR